ncbi:MAG TPA: carboxypeptidase regulatory-like domain-containing protein [Candidatus Dormibacteraeota bacterium]|nr:carboxypeptidase regulatory-like domain-containing protein [Candidatus Dormibacteraeota bacterium]
MRSSRVLLGTLLVLVLCAAAWAQNTGSITGTVTDPSGAAVPGANVVISNADHGINRASTTNSSGEYSQTALPQGLYDVVVTAAGFKKFQAKGVVLDVAQKARVDVALQVGAATTEVVVEGAAVAQVETESSELSGTVTGKEISQLELNGRNFTQLVTLTPGVSNQTGQDEGTVGVYGNVSFSMNGGRIEYNNWELDGGDNMDNGSNQTLNVYPSIDAIAEFKVLTSNYGAQYGRNGSGTVEVETKSGTKAFHGDLYEFLRNDAFNAQNFFNQPFWGGSGVTPEYKKNDYGYTIGGPAYIPGVYNKDKTKTFFFWSQEWRKDIVPGQTFHVPVPSIAERGGDFSDICAMQEVDCPSVGTGGVISGLPAFTANQSTAQALLAVIPQPTGANSATCVPNSPTNPCFYSASPAQATNWREELVRVDHNFSDKIRGTFRYIHDSWQTTTAVPLWTNQGSFPTIGTAFKGPGVSLVTRLTATASPTLLNEFVFSYTADHIILNDTGAWQRPSGFSSNFTDLFPGNGGGVIPGINLVDPTNGVYGNFGQDSGYIPNGIYNSNPTYTFRDNVNKVLGKHILQFGVYIAAAQKNEFGGELANGSFPGYLTFDPTQMPSGDTSGNPFADLLLGNIASFGQQDHLVKYYNRYKLFEPYFQDDWRITNRLTLNLGLRLSLYETYREKQKQAFNFDPAHYAPGQTTVNPDGSVNFLTADNATPSVSDLPNGIVQCGVTSGVPDGCMQPHWFNPAPRIGFAWDPKGDGKTAIRGGYGVFFEHTNGNEGNTESLENSPPLANVVQKVQIIGYANIASSGGGAAQLPLGVVAVPTKAQWPYMQQWHLDVQHEVAPHTIATVSYVGSKGTHLTRESNYNQIFPVTASQNPYLVNHEVITVDPNGGNSPDCGSTFDANGVPLAAMTQGGVPITGQAAVALGIAACGTNPNIFRPFPGYGTITHLEDRAASTYHAMQASVRRSVGQLTISGAYTWSHSIDDSSDRGDGTFVNAYDFAANRGSSNFDQRHIFNFSYIWDLPFFRTPGFTNKLLGGWQFSGIASISSGTPFNPVFNTDNAGVANGVAGAGARPDQVGNPRSGPIPAPDPGFARTFYNTNAYTAPVGLTFGNVGRNVLTNPRRTNFDMALFKHLAIRESLAFEFRAEAFNVFNHTEWSNMAGGGGSAGGDGNNTLGNPGFLQVGSTHLPRILQLGAKFIF